MFCDLFSLDMSHRHQQPQVKTNFNQWIFLRTTPQSYRQRDEWIILRCVPLIGFVLLKYNILLFYKCIPYRFLWKPQKCHKTILKGINCSRSFSWTFLWFEVCEEKKTPFLHVHVFVGHWWYICIRIHFW